MIIYRYISPENLLAEYGGLKKDKDVEFSTDDKVLEISIKPCSFCLIKMPVKEVVFATMPSFHFLLSPFMDPRVANTCIISYRLR